MLMSLSVIHQHSEPYRSTNSTQLLNILILVFFEKEGKGKRGRPITTWRRTIENEIKERGYTWGTIERKANNRKEWRKLVGLRRT
jgi:hypothetical protein